MSRWFRVRCRVDRALGFIGLLVAGPVLAVVAALVRRQDRQRAFLAVDRIGRAGHTFGMWKLRSMRVDRSDGSAAGPALTAADDDRITPIGRRLRAYHLDELPQLVNVARGQMVLIGWRPEAPDYVDVADPAWQAVLASPPGMVGPTQLVVGEWERELIATAPDGSTYEDVVLPVKLDIDRWYLEASSPVVDALVLWSMVRKGIDGRVAPGLASRIRGSVPSAAHLLDDGVRVSGSAVAGGVGG